MRKLLLVFLLLPFALPAQELFVYTEPASNMASKSIGFRSKQLLQSKTAGGQAFFWQPELMWGISKKSMLHADIYLSDRMVKFRQEGWSLYYKYRFFSADDVHSHFRMAAFARVSANRYHVMDSAIDLEGMNSGYQGGLLATILKNKLALSAGASYIKAMDNTSEHPFKTTGYGNEAMSFTLSAGRLMLPVEYKDYDQVNWNLMVELLSQVNLLSKKTYVDLAPSLQWIIKSRMRVDIGYRFPLVNEIQRMADRGALLRLEYNIFNAY